MPASFANKNVGVNKTVTGLGFVLAGAAIVNYNLTRGNSAQSYGHHLPAPSGRVGHR